VRKKRGPKLNFGASRRGGEVSLPTTQKEGDRVNEKRKTTHSDLSSFDPKRTVGFINSAGGLKGTVRGSPVREDNSLLKFGLKLGKKPKISQQRSDHENFLKGPGWAIEIRQGSAFGGGLSAFTMTPGKTAPTG